MKTFAFCAKIQTKYNYKQNTLRKNKNKNLAQKRQHPNGSILKGVGGIDSQRFTDYLRFSHIFLRVVFFCVYIVRNFAVCYCDGDTERHTGNDGIPFFCPLPFLLCSFFDIPHIYIYSVVPVAL